jgi:hypothetical protein
MWEFVDNTQIERVSCNQHKRVIPNVMLLNYRGLTELVRTLAGDVPI